MVRRVRVGRALRGIALAFVVLVIGARIAAPYVIERVVNQKLQDLEGYRGSIDDVDLHLWRGAYEVENLQIEKTDGKVPVPFIALERLDLGVEWRALFDGSVVARVVLFRPQVNFVKGPTKAQSQTGEEADWQQKLDELVPMRIDSFSVVDGEVHYRDFHAKPRVDVALDHLNVRVTNLTNSKELSETRVADFRADGSLMHSGILALEGDIDPFQQRPTFHLKTSLRDLRIRELNDFLKAYVNVDAERGTFSLYSELTANNGSFQGYVKPLIEDLDLLQWKDEKERPAEKLWEGLVGATAEVFENQGKDRLASRVDLDGRFDDPDIHTWQAVVELLRNGFIRALRHGLDAGKSS